MKLRTPALVLIVFILIAAAINYPFATFFLKSRNDPRAPTVTNVFGPEATERGWPVKAPHETEWPRPKQWQEKRSFAYRLIQVWGEGSHQMECQFIGWPLPVYEQVRMWWPWDDPIWQTAEPPDSALRIHWPGALLNPIIVGCGAWLVLVLPFFVGAAYGRRARTRRGHCVKCGYDLRGDFDAGCPECGWNRETEVAT